MYAYRATTDKLNDAFQRIEEAGDKVIDRPIFTGGRDWIIFVQKAEDQTVQTTRWDGTTSVVNR